MGGGEAFLLCSFFSIRIGGGAFSLFEGFLLLFLHVGAFFLYVLLLRGIFQNVGAFLLLFSPHLSLWAPFFWFLPPPYKKFLRVPMPACPLTPIGNMQCNHSLTTSCHFRDIVSKYFLIYISVWLTTFKFPKMERKHHYLTQNIVFFLFMASIFIGNQ